MASSPVVPLILQSPTYSHPCRGHEDLYAMLSSPSPIPLTLWVPTCLLSSGAMWISLWPHGVSHHLHAVTLQ